MIQLFDAILTEASGSKPPMTKALRKKMEDHIYKFFHLIDPTDNNVIYYKDLFKKMSDKDFDKYFDNLFNDDMCYMKLFIEDYEYNLSLDNAMKALDYLGIPFFEYVIQPHVNMDKDNPVVSQAKVPVGYAHLKRMQQTASNKNKGSMDANKRSALTNQVTGTDKNGRSTDLENYNLILSDGEAILKEFLSVRGDDPVMYSEALANIAEKGFLDMDELTDLPENKTTLNVVDTFFVGMGLKTDLLTKDLALPKTLE